MAKKVLRDDLAYSFIGTRKPAEELNKQTQLNESLSKMEKSAEIASQAFGAAIKEKLQGQQAYQSKPPVAVKIKNSPHEGPEGSSRRWVNKTYIFRPEQVEILHLISWDRRIPINELMREVVDTYMEANLPKKHVVEKYQMHQKMKAERALKRKSLSRRSPSA